jgi:hypothetical protein
VEFPEPARFGNIVRSLGQEEDVDVAGHALLPTCVRADERNGPDLGRKSCPIGNFRSNRRRLFPSRSESRSHAAIVPDSDDAVDLKRPDKVGRLPAHDRGSPRPQLGDPNRRALEGHATNGGSLARCGVR